MHSSKRRHTLDLFRGKRHKEVRLVLDMKPNVFERKAGISRGHQVGVRSGDRDRSGVQSRSPQDHDHLRRRAENGRPIDGSAG